MFKKGFLLDTSDGIGDERSDDRSLWWGGDGAAPSKASTGGWGGKKNESSWKNGGSGWGRSAKTSGGWGSGWGSPPPSTSDDGTKTKASAEEEARRKKEEEEERRARYAAMPTYTKATGVPKTDITIWYARRYGDLLDGRPISSEDYETRSEECDIRIRARGNNVITYKLKYTSVFICPVSGDRYPSGRWGDPIAKEGDEGGGELGWEKGSSVVWWFTKKKDAEHAAARRALDCLSLMEDHIGTLQGPPLRICGEEPTLPANMEPFLRHHERQKQRRDDEDHKEDDGMEKDDHDGDDEDDAVAAPACGEDMDVSDDAKGTPRRRQRRRRKPQPRDEHDRAIPTRPDRLTQQKSALMDWYRRRHLDDVFNTNALASAFETRCDGGPAHERLWTAEFTCPISREKYPSGRFGRKENGGEGEAGPDGGNSEDCRYALEEGDDCHTVWYKNKKEAEHAAAARALDAFDAMDEELGRITEARRLCEEPPIPVEDASVYRAEPGLDEESVAETARSRTSYRKARTGPVAVAVTSTSATTLKTEKKEESEPKALEGEGPLRGDFVPVPMETS